ncbi:hypothetical protein KJ855_03420 [Patescibacteria group bacterium]|nr:hypothetical protein [Patescibacteria group bacterium]
MENKVCKQCGSNFVVEDEDAVFYEKMSPEFAGKKYVVLSPTWCPECRQKRRLIWRNERSLYKSKCAKSGQDMISIYSPDKTDYVVYERDEWWKDDWDAISYGRDFDFDRPFFPQFDELLHKVPKMALNNADTVDCKYANFIAGCKNCYMSFVIYYGSENCHYCYWTYRGKDCVDVTYADGVELCYDCAMIYGCYGCRYSVRLHDCRDCYYSWDLRGCKDCIFSNNLSNKQYYVENKPYSKEEYEKIKADLGLGRYSKTKEYLKKFNEMRGKAVVKFANIVGSENVSGDDLLNCKNVKNCFSCITTEDSRYSYGQEAVKNVYDSMGGTYEWCLECNHTGWANNCIGTSGVLNSNNMFYCYSCHGCHDCFGCAGLRKKEYCIFNEQYSKEEYEQLAGKIAEHMQKSGEWGEFYPMNMSAFGYNESVANSYLPMTKEEVLKYGAKWLDIDYSMKYDGPLYEPHDDIVVYQKSKDEVDKLLAGILKCETSGRPFKIMPQELAFYLAQGIPIPREHYDVRHDRRFNTRNPRKLWHRQCMCEGQGSSGKDQGSSGGCMHEGRCKNEFETTYAPERSERVYCEECYQKVIS